MADVIVGGLLVTAGLISLSIDAYQAIAKRVRQR